MPRAHYFYTLFPLKKLEEIVKKHQQDFDELIHDTFTQDELITFEGLLDTIGAICAQPIIAELSFDDFFYSDSEEEKQRDFFNKSQSSICVENLPELIIHPFQVTYLIELARNFDEILIDQGGMSELIFKKQYVDNLRNYKNIFSLEKNNEVRKIIPHTSNLVNPIDFLFRDVSDELKRLVGQKIHTEQNAWTEKMTQIYSALRDGASNPQEALIRTGLNTKDFGDHLEKLKFALKRIT